MRKLFKAARVLPLLALLAVASPAMPIGSDFDGTYYSDYFTTWSGWYHTYCDNSYESLGTLDGETFYSEKIGCSTGILVRRCMQKINGQWTMVQCPPWL